MQRLKFFIRCIILATMPVVLAYPQHNLPRVSFQTVNYEHQQETEKWTRPNTYDEIIRMLEDLESGELEKRYSSMQLEQVNDYLVILAKEGVLPDEFAEKTTIEEDTYDLMYGKDSVFQLTHYLENSNDYITVPAVFNDYSNYSIVQCGKISKAWKKTKKFVKKHKKAIIIGAVVVVAVTAVAVALVVASSVGTAAAVSSAAAAASSSGSESSDSSKSEPQAQTTSNDLLVFKEAMKEQIVSFKESLAQEIFFQPDIAEKGLSLEETGRVVGPIFAHESFHHFNDHLSRYPRVFQEMQNITTQHNFELPPMVMNNSINYGHSEIDRRFASNYAPLFSNPTKEVNFNALSYQMRGEMAHSYGYYDQAVHDFSKAIHINPTDPISYLQRSASYFDMGQYDKSIEDFHHYTDQIEKSSEKFPFSTPEFTLGFAKGFPKGIYESGKGIMLFLGDLVTHPIHTATQMYDALGALAKLAHEDEWKMIGEALSPEIHQLITEWDDLTSDKKGELAGYAFGKHGADIAVPGAIAKIANKSIKSARELTAILKNLERAEGILILETATEVGNTAKVGEIINNGKKATFLGEELGFTAKEMGQLQQAGKLENTLTKTYEHLSLSMQESVQLFKNAGKKLKPYQGTYMPESKIRELIHETNIPTFPRPKGIPDNFRVKLSNKPGGMKYVHPKHEHISIRVMPGKPHSPFPYQKKPYVIHKKNGQTLDKFGNVVIEKSVEAHIPIEEFIYLGE